MSGIYAVSGHPANTEDDAWSEAYEDLDWRARYISEVLPNQANPQP